MSERKVVLSVRISPEVMERLEKLEQRSGVSRAQIVERCLLFGIRDEEEFIEWLESPIHGPIQDLLMHPKVFHVVKTIMGIKGKIDPTQKAIADGKREERRAKRMKAKPASE